MQDRLVSVALGFAVFIIIPAETGAESAVDEQYSAAQIALFGTPHLDNIDRPVTLEYEYRRETRPGESFVDTVAMIVKEISSDGAKTVAFEYLTGANQRQFGDVENFRGNPLIMVFLEDDLRRMAKKFDGGGVYMRNRIRHAFRDRSETQAVTIEINGSTVTGTQVTITPFVGDRYRERLGEYEHKVYRFVVSSAVPGGIYRIRSTVPSPTAPEVPIARDSLTFRAVRK